MSENQFLKYISPDYKPEKENQFLKYVKPTKPIDDTPKRTVGGTLSDAVTSVAAGGMDLVRGGVGLADVVTGGLADDTFNAVQEKTGHLQDVIEDWYSPAQKAANERVENTKGFVNTAKEMVKNPSTIGHGLLRTLGPMAGSGLIARGLAKAAPKVMGTTLGRIVGSGVGEGAIQAGGMSQDVRGETGDLTGKQALQSAASGMGTGLITMLSGRVANKLGFTDVDNLLAGVARETGKKITPMEITKALVAGGFTEGILEEMSQSAQETVWMNAATGKPLMQGVEEAAAKGAVLGSVMGSGVNAGQLASNALIKDAVGNQDSTDELEAGIGGNPLGDEVNKAVNDSLDEVAQDAFTEGADPGIQLGREKDVEYAGTLAKILTEVPIADEADRAQRVEMLYKFYDNDVIADEAKDHLEETGLFEFLGIENEKRGEIGRDIQKLHDDLDLPAMEKKHGPYMAAAIHNEAIAKAEAEERGEIYTPRTLAEMQEAAQVIEQNDKEAAGSMMDIDDEGDFMLDHIENAETVQAQDDERRRKNRFNQLQEEDQKSREPMREEWEKQQAKKQGFVPAEGQAVPDTDADYNEYEPELPEDKSFPRNIDDREFINEQIDTQVDIQDEANERKRKQDYEKLKEEHRKKVQNQRSLQANTPSTPEETVATVEGTEPGTQEKRISRQEDLEEAFAGLKQQFSPAGTPSSAQTAAETFEGTEPTGKMTEAEKVADQKIATETRRKEITDTFEQHFRDIEDSRDAGYITEEQARQFHSEVFDYRQQFIQKNQKAKLDKTIKNLVPDEQDLTVESSTLSDDEIKSAKKEAEGIVRSDPRYEMMAQAKKSGGIDLFAAEQMFSQETVKILNKKYPGLFQRPVAGSDMGTTGVDEAAAELGYDSANEMINSWLEAPTIKSATASLIKEREAQQAKTVQEVEDDFDWGTGKPLESTVPENHEVIDNPESLAHGEEMNTNPSEEQKEAENYKTVKKTIDGLTVSVENPMGTTRSGTDPSGKKWSIKMQNDYGRILGSIGHDKDHVDIFVAPGYKGGATHAYVINQKNKNGSFDEHKTVIGVNSEAEALDLYNSNYEKGWDGAKSITKLATPSFKKWVTGSGPAKGELVRARTVLAKDIKKAPTKASEYYTDKNGDYITVREGSVKGTYAFWRVGKDDIAGRGNRLRLRPATYYKSKQEGLDALVEYAAGKDWQPHEGKPVEVPKEKPVVRSGKPAPKPDLHSTKDSPIQLLNQEFDKLKASYSGDILGANDQIKQPVEINGKMYIVTAAMSPGKGEDGWVEAWEVVPAHQYPHNSHLYDTVKYQWDNNIRERGDHSGQIAWKGKDHTNPKKNQFVLVNQQYFSTTEFNGYDSKVEQDYQEYDYYNEGPTVRVAKVVGPEMPQLEANDIVDSWKQAAASENKSQNADKTILSLFDESGVWSGPFVDAGYNVVQIDLVHGVDANDIDIEWIMNHGGLDDVHGLLAACPCTDFSSSGARWWKVKDQDGRTEASIELVRQVERMVDWFRPKFWTVENPVGRMQKLTGLPDASLVFNPNHYGDPYTKKTLLYGKFNTDLPTAHVEASEGSRIHKLWGNNKSQKRLRSETPEGFSYSFFMANSEQQQAKNKKPGKPQYSLGETKQQEVTRDLLEDVFPGQQINSGMDGGTTITTKGGLAITVTPNADIKIDLDTASRAYKRAIGKNDVAQGSFQIVDGRAIISLAETAGKGTVKHEAYHAAEEMVLTKDEVKTLRKKYGSAENRAEAYANWDPKEENGIFQKIKDFFQQLANALGLNSDLTDVKARKIFQDLYQGKTWNRTGVNERNQIPVGDIVIGMVDTDPQYQLDQQKWLEAPQHLDIFGTVNNRLKKELEVLETLLGPVDSTQRFPGKQNLKQERPLTRTIKARDLGVELFKARDDGRLGRLIDKKISPQKLADERKLTGKERKKFLAELKQLRSGPMMTEVDMQGKPVLSQNGKAGQSVDLILGTCQPTEPCQECYAAASMIRMSAVRKAFRNTVHMLVDPKNFGARIAMEAGKVHRSKLPFIRLLGSGDLTSDESVEAFNELAKKADRPIHIFSRHHDNLAKLEGTKVAPFIKMGSLDSDLVDHYGLEFLKLNMAERGINNAFLNRAPEEKQIVDDLVEADSLGLILSISEELHSGLGPQAQKRSCPCDAEERSYLGSCRQCALSNAGCYTGFLNTAVDTNGKVWSLDDNNLPKDTKPTLSFLQGATPIDSGTHAEAFSEVANDIIKKSVELINGYRRKFLNHKEKLNEHNNQFQARLKAWNEKEAQREKTFNEREAKRKENVLKKGKEEYVEKLFEPSTKKPKKGRRPKKPKNEQPNVSITMKDLRWPEESVTLVDKDLYIERTNNKNAERAKASGKTPVVITEKDLESTDRRIYTDRQTIIDSVNIEISRLRTIAETALVDQTFYLPGGEIQPPVAFHKGVKLAAPELISKEDAMAGNYGLKGDVKFSIVEAQEGSGTTQVENGKAYVNNLEKYINRTGNTPESILDYGAGLGTGTDAMQAHLPGATVHSLEPNPQRWKGKVPPTYTDNTQIDRKYDLVMLPNVLNVVSKEIRSAIVKDAISHLSPNGQLIIGVRGAKGDVLNAKNSRPGDEDGSIWITKKSKGQEVEVYQKGFDGKELVDYLTKEVPKGYTVSKYAMGNNGAIISPPGVQFSAGKQAGKADVRKELSEALSPQIVKSLLDANILHIIKPNQIPPSLKKGLSKTDTIDGFINGENIFLVEGNIGEGRAMDLMIHELGSHEYLDNMFKDNMPEIVSMLEEGAKKDTRAGRDIRAAKARIPKNTPDQHFNSEWLAYYVQDAKRGDSVYRKIMAYLKDALIKMGFNPKTVGLRPEDLRQIATIGIRRKAKKTTKNAPKVAGESKQSKKAGQWYSRLEEFLTPKLPKNGSAAGLLGSINSWVKSGKISAPMQEELEWSGLQEMLESREGKITKDEVLQFLENNGVKLEEKMKAGTPTDSTQDMNDLEADYLEENPNGWEVVDSSMGGDKYYMVEDQDGNIIEDEDGQMEMYPNRSAAADARGEQILSEFSEMSPDEILQALGRSTGISVGGGVKFEPYKLKGGENYRELLLMMPADTGPFVGMSPLKAARAMFNKSITELNDDQRAAVRKAIDGDASKTYAKGHYDEPNVLAHIRFNDRVDANGNKVLFIEEIQSDWHQDARTKGYGVPPPAIPELDKIITDSKLNELQKALASYSEDDHYTGVADGAFNALQEETKKVEQKLNKALKDKGVDNRVIRRNYKDKWELISTNNDGQWQQTIGTGKTPQEAYSFQEMKTDGVPNAPFKKTWSMLAMKRMIRHAAENGYDSIAWTTGEQQADRYDLSKQIKEINYEQDVDGTDNYDISALDLQGNEVIAEEDVTIERVSDIVGKEMAEKIQNGEGTDKSNAYRSWRQLSGLDLKVGGKGMIGFYNKMLPNNTNKFIKKFKSKVEVMDIPAQRVVYTVEQQKNNPLYYQVTGSNGKWFGGFPSYEIAQQWADDAHESEARADTGSEYPGQQLGFKITPELSGSAMGTGMPLFSQQGINVGEQLKARKGREGEIRYPIKKGRKNVGHISGFMKGDALDVWATNIDQDLQGTGAYQDALQEVASNYTGGIVIQKYQASKALQKAAAKVPGAIDTNETISIPGKETKLSVRNENLKDIRVISSTEQLNAEMDGEKSTSSVSEGEKIVTEILRKLAAVSSPAVAKSRFGDEALDKAIENYEKARAVINDPLKSAAEKQKFAAGFVQKLPVIPRAKLHQALSSISRVKNPNTQLRRLNGFMNKADKVLTDYLKGEIIDRIDTNVKPTASQIKTGKVKQGRGADFERDIKYLREKALYLDDVDGLEVAIEREMGALIGEEQALNDQLAATNDPKKQASIQEKLDDVSSKINLVQVFGGIEGQSFDELVSSWKALSQFLSEGRLPWRNHLEVWRERNKANRKKFIEESTGEEDPENETVAERTQRLEKEKTLFARFKEAISATSNMIQSWELMLDKVTRPAGGKTLSSWSVNHYGSIAHKATRDQERMTLDTNDEVMDAAMVIFHTDNHAKLAEKFAKLDQTESGAVKTYLTENGEDLAISPLQAAYWYQISRDKNNPNVQKTFAKMGITKETLNQIEDYMGPELKAWADYLVDTFYQDFHEDTNTIHKQVYGIDLDKNLNYVPWHRIVTGKAADKEKEGFLASIKPGTVKKSGLKSRSANADQHFKIMNINDVLVSHIADMSHFKAWAIPTKEINGTFNSPEVQSFIRQHHGASTAKTIRRFQDRFVRSDGEIIEDLKFLDMLRGNVTKAMIGMNPVVFLKQLSSIPAYMADIPAADWFKYTGEFLTDPVRYSRILGKSTMMQARYKRGFERDVATAMKKGGSDVVAQKKRFSDSTMILTQLGDKMAISIGGYAVYKHHLERLKGEGMSHRKAHLEALQKFEEATERAQQSAHTKDIGWFQGGTPIMRLFTMFMTSPASYSRQIFTAFRNMKDDPADSAKRLFVYGVLMPVIFQSIADALLAIDGDDDDRERLLTNQLKALAMGAFNGLPVIRTMVQGYLQVISGSALYRSQFTPAIQGFETSLRALSDLGKFIDGGTDRIGPDEYLERGLLGLVHTMGYATGVPTKPLERITTGWYDAATGETEHPFRRSIGYSKYAVGE